MEMNFLIELAVIVDVGEPFVKACYNLEGDGALAPLCYEILLSVRASVHWPNTQAVAWRLAQKFHTPGLEQQLMTHALSCVQPGIRTNFGKSFYPWLMLSRLLNSSTQAKLQTYIQMPPQC